MSRNQVFWRALIERRFSQYDEALIEAESHFEQASNEVLPYSREELEAMDDDERQEIVEYYAEDYLKFTEYFPIPLRNSFLIGYYSILEFYLDDFCNVFKRSKSITFDSRLLRGEGIFRSKDYIEKVCGLSIFGTREWNDIVQINKIRNSFVHNLGIYEKPNEIQTYLGANSTLLALDDHDRIIIKKGYLQSISKTMQRFLNTVIANM